MGPWPFDRLIAACSALCADHEVFIQTGTSTLVPPCPHEPFIGYDETMRRLAEADVVITHAGNTVRLVERMGKVPIAVAREAARGEMRNDHQVEYLRAEEPRGRVIALWGPLSELARTVADHPATEEKLLAAMKPLAAVDQAALESVMDRATQTPSSGPCSPARRRSSVPIAEDNPFAKHPTARYAWAFEQLRSRTGRHLDLGIGDGTFLSAVRDRTALRVVGADPHPGYLTAFAGNQPLVRVGENLPFADASFDSVTMLDVLEHTRDDRSTLAEVHRVLRPGGLLVLTVPARHVFSFLDPDNAKLRLPRLHRAIYAARFGREVYRQRFEDSSDGLRGDMAWDRSEHTNYRPEDLLGMLTQAGFRPQSRDGANLFWRFLQVPALLAPARARALFDAPLRIDGSLFKSANLFLTAVRS
jgi:SAM-dependent methyltransferase